ncbi:alkene reductase [Filimonas effusa]|uniref:Alkene reductase n=1 Tax=Filimonas effusa TaxID=2508721 RepID=A0A4Q1D5V1_9BACT|nr:alkene reductase [Filimonas effusa]RXK83875.1 alkene reductase [Filimonas effusa]
MSAKLPFTPYQLGDITLTNRFVMAPMTRSRAINNLPNTLIQEYYSQRSTAGLIITEGTAPSPDGLGYARMPGIYSNEQIAEWRQVTDAVHRRGGKIFVQLMHTGRVSHPLNMPAGTQVLAPSAVACNTEVWTDSDGSQPLPVPHEMTPGDITATQVEFVQAARNAIAAGFDGVELHAANGYLLEQFLAPSSNQRTDDYGGSITNRARFVLEIARAVSKAIGARKTAVRLSPYGTFNDIAPYAETEEAYSYLAEELQKLDLIYLHLADQGNAPESIRRIIRQKFRNTLILAGGYDLERTEEALNSGFANLVAFGRPYIGNPDLTERYRNNWPLEKNIDTTTFYSAGAKGYTDYPAYQLEEVAQLVS